jgi:lysophospholipase L1-like esterase
MTRLRHSLWLTPATLFLASCGGSGGPPTIPTTPPPPTYTVTATVFYDENENGRLDAQEHVRVPGVEVSIGAASAVSASATGQAVVSGISEGPAAVGVRLATVPAYYRVTQVPSIQVPGPAAVQIPLTLEIGNNHANLYLGIGDSITSGDGSGDGQGYRGKLQALLVGQLGRADVRTWGREGTNSAEGASVTRKTLRWYDPAYTLILYGTNDWQECKNLPVAECYTIDSLRSMVEDTKGWSSLPVLGTILPANPKVAPASRNQWIDDMNARIKAMAHQEGVAVADLNAAFKAAADLPSLYDDDIHPNDAGYEVLAQGWLKGITGARSTTASSRSRFGFSLGR